MEKWQKTYVQYMNYPSQKSFVHQILSKLSLACQYHGVKGKEEIANLDSFLHLYLEARGSFYQSCNTLQSDQQDMDQLAKLLSVRLIRYDNAFGLFVKGFVRRLFNEDLKAVF